MLLYIFVITVIWSLLILTVKYPVLSLSVQIYSLMILLV
jgi:hypothetical protein